MDTVSCCPAPLPLRAPHQPTHRPWWQRLWLDLQAFARQAWQAQREGAQRRAEWRSLQGLSDATLRDIGLADRQTDPSYTLGVMDSERNRWS